MCLQAEGLDDDDYGIIRVRQVKGLSDDGGGVVRGQGIRNASEVSETTTEAAGVRQRAQGIYGGDRGVVRGRLAQRLQK